ncbi:PAS domain S-box protein [Paenibacillus sp. FSL H8-0261]|uniref:sensor histidine kinase n=1 Tax=Paenibacillus sp. FSL H8-0261 TaxID=2921381 RepID=UPI0032525931
MHSLGDENVITWSMDMEENLLTMSRILEEWVGCTSKTKPHSPSFLRELVNVVDRDRYDAYMERLNAGHISSLEYRMQLPTAGLKWVQNIGTPILNKENKVCRIDGVMLDITEQKTAQIQLESTFSLYQQMFSNLDVAVWSYDYVSKKVLFISDAILNITGYSVEQAKEDDFWLRIAHKEENPLFHEIISSVGQGIPQLSEYRIIHASGEPRWLQVRIIPSLDESQAVVRLDGILADITERKLMKEALLKSEQRYKSLFDYNSDVVCEVNLQGNILAINSAAEQITGEALSMVGENLSIMNLFGVENIPRMSDLFERTVRGSAQHYVVASSRKDGSVSHWTMKNIPIYVNSRIVGAFVVAKDITSTVEVEHKLAQREAEYRLIINNMKDMMGVLDQKGNFIVASPSCETLIGIPVGLIKDTTILKYIDPDEQESLREQISNIFRTKASKMFYNRFIHTKGYILNLECLATPVLGEDGEVMSIVIVARDITKRVQMENELRESEEFNQQLIKMSPEAVVLHSDYKFVYVNFSCLGLFGVSDESQLIGKNIFNWAHPEYLPLAKERMREIYKEPYKILVPIEQKVVRSDGTIIDVEVTASSILYKGKVACISIFRDISDRKKADEDRQHTEQIIRESEERYFRLQTSLDQFSEDLFGVMKISHMEQRLLREVRETLQITNIKFIAVESNHDKLCEIIETEQGYSLKIGESRGKSYLLSINEKTLLLEISSIRVWLETITRYVSVLFDHFLLIEDLTKDLELAASKQVAPTWLLRFMFNLSENERKRLAQDLHDSALQEQIIWYRKLDFLLGERSINGELREQLEQISEGLLDVIYQLRIICNELRPPALINEGLISSLETLFEFTQLRTNYQIYFESEGFTHKLDDEVLIGLYRIVQELLANAAKHSFATEVHITLVSEDNHIHLDYKDNGIGMNLFGEDSLTSMGIYGMKERVRSMDGSIVFRSPDKKGLAVNISIPTD